MKATPDCRLVIYDERFRDASFEWFKDEELRRLSRTPVVTRQEQLAWFDSLPERTSYLIRGVEIDGAPAGACGLKNLTANDAEYWGYLGEAAQRGRGVGRWMVERCLDWARELGLGSVWLRVGLDNPIAIALYRRAGFVDEERRDDELVMRRTLP